MLTIQLQGGLGNQLFQLAALEYYSKTTKLPLFINEKVTPRTHHSKQNYYNSIFLNWNPDYKDKLVDSHIDEEHLKFDTSKISCLHGYFQDYRLVTELFISKLNIDNNILKKYPNIQNTVFLHIRGGDYVNHPLHHVDLNEYYLRAVAQFKDERFSVFTNDKEYAKGFLRNVNYNFVEENEVDWWGGFINKNRLIIIPSRWVNSDSFPHKNYQVPGWMVF